MIFRRFTQWPDRTLGTLKEVAVKKAYEAKAKKATHAAVGAAAEASSGGKPGRMEGVMDELKTDWPPMKPASAEELEKSASEAMSRFRVVLLTEDRTEIEPGSGYVRGGLPFPLQGDASFVATGGTLPASGKPIRYGALIDPDGEVIILVDIPGELCLACGQSILIRRECFLPEGK